MTPMRTLHSRWREECRYRRLRRARRRGTLLEAVKGIDGHHLEDRAPARDCGPVKGVEW